MRYCWISDLIEDLLWASRSTPPALWCYFIRSWSYWKVLPDRERCTKCKREWHEQYYGW